MDGYDWWMILNGTIARGSATPETEEFDAVSAEGEDYAAAVADLESRVPEGWKLSDIRHAD